jgi:hypothetical protein
MFTSSHRRLGRASVALATVLGFAPAAASAAPVNVKINVRAPFTSPSLGAEKLAGIENHGSTPFNKSFSIPYDTLQAEIDKAIDDMIPNTISGVEVCTDPCPDVTWSVKIKPKFKFTKKNQPTVKQIGTSGQSKVRIELTTEARLDVHADVHAETWFDSVDAPVDVFVVVGMKARVDVSLWPNLAATKPGTNTPGVELEFTLVDSDIKLDINGKAAELGLKWGTIIGLSPIGVLAGGPILGPILAIIGDEAADAATKEIGRVFDEQVAVAFKAQTDKLEDLANDYINPLIMQATDLKAGVLATKIPGVNKTIEELSGDFGAQLKLHTVASGSSVSSTALLRMSNTAADGKILGKLRIPKKQCIYVSVNMGGMKGMLPAGLADANTDLAGKVGAKCSTTIAQKFNRRTFLGHNPKDSLGAAAESLPNWSGTTGALAYTGNMTETTDYYECGYELTGLPKAAVLELAAGDLQQRSIQLNRRVLEVTAAGKTMVFDNELKPLPVSGGNSSLVIGGKGECGGGSLSGGLTPNKMQELKDMLDPDKCPTCGIKLRPGSNHIYEVTNMKAFLGTTFGMDLARRVEQAKATTRATAKPGATTRTPAGRAPAGAR